MQTPPTMNPNATPFQTRQNQAANGDNDGFKQLIDMMSLPKPSLITFSGDPMQYHVFMNSFKTCIGSAAVSDASKLNRLLELCQGKARTVLMPCALGDPTKGYKAALKLLEDRFGNDYVISEAWVNKIVNGPPIKSHLGRLNLLIRRM